MAAEMSARVALPSVPPASAVAARPAASRAATSRFQPRPSTSSAERKSRGLTGPGILDFRRPAARVAPASATVLISVRAARRPWAVSSSR